MNAKYHSSRFLNKCNYLHTIFLKFLLGNALNVTNHWLSCIINHYFESMKTMRLTQIFIKTNELKFHLFTALFLKFCLQTFIFWVVTIKFKCLRVMMGVFRMQNVTDLDTAIFLNDFQQVDHLPSWVMQFYSLHMYKNGRVVISLDRMKNLT